MKLNAAGWLLTVTSNHCYWSAGALSVNHGRWGSLYFLTVTSSSPESSLTLAVPQVVSFPVALNRQPKRPSFFSPHCPAFTATTNHPDPDGDPALFPGV